MALIKCKHCGKSISDKASECPKCRMPLKEETRPITAVSHTMDVTTGTEISDADIITSESSEKYYKKISTISYVLISVIILGIFIGFWIKWMNMGKEETERTTAQAINIEYKETTVQLNTSQNIRTKPSHPFIGTWEYKYPKNWSDYQTLKITINEDKTAVANVIRKTVSHKILDKTFYGSWYEAHSSDGKTQIRFHFNDTDHYFRGRYYRDMEVCATEGDKYWDATYCVLMDGYLYEDINQASAKNPEKRVKMSKIN